MSSLKDFDPTSPASFCIITPINYLEEYATQGDTHLVLAHLVDKDYTYASFYREMSDRGDRVIMDNGAFELGQSYHPDMLIELGHKCGADAIVLPDYPGQPSSKTIEAANTWIPLFKDEGFKTMFVPQSSLGDLEDWIRAYQWGADNPDVDIMGMSILGIPNALPHIHRAFARVVMTEILNDRNLFAPWKYHHYLGLNAGPALELPTLIGTEYLNSCDSSNPVWAGINGIRYNITSDSFLPVSKQYLRDVDFFCPATDKRNIHEAIQYNLDLTLELFKCDIR